MPALSLLEARSHTPHHPQASPPDFGDIFFVMKIFDADDILFRVSAGSNGALGTIVSHAVSSLSVSVVTSSSLSSSISVMPESSKSPTRTRGLYFLSAILVSTCLDLAVQGFHACQQPSR